MTLTPVDHAALMFGMQDVQLRRQWLERAAAECERRARLGGDNTDLLERAAATARARLAPPPEDLP